VIDDRADVWGAGAYEWDQPEAEDSPSHLVFEVSPGDAVVYVDDEFAGMAFELGDLEGGLAVDPGEHVVTIVRPGYEGATVKIEVRPGDSGKVEIDLEEATKAQPAALQPSVKPGPV
jgi:hypothetical protein